MHCALVIALSIIYDVKGEEKKQLTVADLLQKFEVAGENALSDRMVLGAK